jgi:signal transduction histidine kinase
MNNTNRNWDRSSGVIPQRRSQTKPERYDRLATTSESSPPQGRKTKSGVILTRIGVVLAAILGALFAYLGSPISGVAIGSMAVSLTIVTTLVPDNVPLSLVANVFTAQATVVFLVVGLRTGGLSSPAVVWCFFHPITSYLAAGRRSAIAWTGVSAVQIGMFALSDRLGLSIAHDISPEASNIILIAGFLICVLHVGLVLAGAESVKRVSQEATDRANRAAERERILGDMHDGVGSQLLGLMIQVRAKRIDDERLLRGLGDCLDDLKLIVDSLDPAERPFAVAIAELRTRTEPRCEAVGVALNWSIDDEPWPVSAEQTIQILRALQEMTNNALRHSQTDRIDVWLHRVSPGTGLFEVCVRDYGVGFDLALVSRSGRGMTSLRTRAQRLAGDLTVEPGDPGTTVGLRFRL